MTRVFKNFNIMFMRYEEFKTLVTQTGEVFDSWEQEFRIFRSTTK